MSERKEVTPRKASLMVKKWLKDNAVPYTKVRGYSNSFEGLGYGDYVFVDIEHEYTSPQDWMKEVKEAHSGWRFAIMLKPGMFASQG